MNAVRSCGKAIARAAAFFAVVASVTSTPVFAQQNAQSGLVVVDSISVEGNQRVQSQVILSLFAVQPGQEITYRAVQRGMKALLASGQFADVVVRATSLDPYVLVVEVEEHPFVRRVMIEGLETVSAGEVRDTTGLDEAAPLNRQRILDAQAYIRAELASEGIPFAQIDERIVPIEGRDNEVDLVINVSEGQRVTIAQVDFIGNDGIDDGTLAGAMDIKAEGFWWFRSGSFDPIDYDIDLQESVPELYRSRGYLDAVVTRDTIIVDPTSGKARIEVTVDEGEQYYLGEFNVEGNTVFTNEELEEHFRTRPGGGILGTLGLSGGGEVQNSEGQVFDAEAFKDAIQVVQERYRNEGYLYIQVNPIVSVAEADGGPPKVDATWEVIESTPAIVNRISIVGNEYTYEWVIRNQMIMIPGDVYSQDRLLRSYQNINALGFFEAPLPFPDIEPLDNGDVDITFHVVEKQTGSINFGTSVGGGVGLSGFVGYEQPNLFGQAKAGTLRWDFGRFLNSFEMSYTDPAMFQTRTSGTVSLFNTRDRFFQFSSGRRKRIGSTVRVGFPWPNSQYTRLFLGYGISRTTYELFNDVNDRSLFGRPPGIQSQASIGITRSTLNHPLFPTLGSRQNINVEQNGGILGGDGQFTRVLGDGSWWVPVGSVGGSDSGGGLSFALGLTLRGGAIFGDASAFPFERFWMGGVQFGQNLRGYDETTVTPRGFFPEGSAGVADIDRLGDAFFSLTAEYAIRMGSQLGLSLFYDAGSVWSSPSQFDPTSLFRGAGAGVQIVTPFGPIGLDYAYGFDRDFPGWQLHFRMGPGF
jgi:outer membrane protein insertion porin family